LCISGSSQIEHTHVPGSILGEAPDASKHLSMHGDENGGLANHRCSSGVTEDVSLFFIVFVNEIKKNREKIIYIF
jgi:hypothetical protein